MLCCCVVTMRRSIRTSDHLRFEAKKNFFAFLLQNLPAGFVPVLLSFSKITSGLTLASIWTLDFKGFAAEWTYNLRLCSSAVEFSCPLFCSLIKQRLQWVRLGLVSTATLRHCGIAALQHCNQVDLNCAKGPQPRMGCPNRSILNVWSTKQSQSMFLPHLLRSKHPISGSKVVLGNVIRLGG